MRYVIWFLTMNMQGDIIHQFPYPVATMSQCNETARAKNFIEEYHHGKNAKIQYACMGSAVPLTEGQIRKYSK